METRETSWLKGARPKKKFFFAGRLTKKRSPTLPDWVLQRDPRLENNGMARYRFLSLLAK
jgi:hypothetical protein